MDRERRTKRGREHGRKEGVVVSRDKAATDKYRQTRNSAFYNAISDSSETRRRDLTSTDYMFYFDESISRR